MEQTSNPFDAGTFGARYFESIKSLPRAELLRREKANDNHLTYTMDEECKRMVVGQAIRAALA